MKFPGFEKRFSPKSADRADYEALIWKKAEELDALKKEIQAHIAELEAKMNSRDFRDLNLAEQEERGNDEQLYWQLQAELKSLEADENRLQRYLEDLDNGVVDEELFRAFLDQVQESQDATRLSGRKKHILEEKERLGEDPRNIDAEIGFGASPHSLTTGRGLKRVKTGGQDDPVSAFYYYTADTHGGKVDHGKGGDAYISKSGRRIRKR